MQLAKLQQKYEQARTNAQWYAVHLHRTM